MPKSWYRQNFYPSFDGAPGRKQKCWSHIIRAARDLAEKKQPPPMAKKFHEELQEIYHDAKECAKGLKDRQGKKEGP